MDEKTYYTFNNIKTLISYIFSILFPFSPESWGAHPFRNAEISCFLFLAVGIPWKIPPSPRMRPESWGS